VDTALGRLELTHLGAAQDQAVRGAVLSRSLIESGAITSTAHGFAGIAAAAGPELFWTADGTEWHRAGSIDLASVTGITANGDDLVVFGSGAMHFGWDGDGWSNPQPLEIPIEISSMALGTRGGAVAVGTTTVGVEDGAYAGRRHIVWYSTDGTHFHQASTPPTGLPAPAEGVEEEGSSYSGRCEPSSIWGPALTQQPLPTADGYAMLVATYAPDLSRAPICEPVVWRSDVGDTWTRVPGDAGFGPGAFVYSVVEHHGRFVAVGGLTVENDRPIGAVWLSDDAVSWTRVAGPHDFASANPAHFTSPAIASSAYGFLIADHDDLLWVSATGETWDGPYYAPFETDGWVPPYFHGSGDLLFVRSASGSAVVARIQPPGDS
jgi:hypothetical protein